MINIKTRISPELWDEIQNFQAINKYNKKVIYDLALKNFFDNNSEIKPITYQESKFGQYRSIGISDEINEKLNEYAKNYKLLYKINLPKYVIIVQAIIDFIKIEQASPNRLSDLQLKLTNLKLYTCPTCGKEIYSFESVDVSCNICNTNFISKT